MRKPIDTASYEERFWAKVRKSSGCWEWTGSTFKRGYGQLKVRCSDGLRVHLPAHRLSWELHFGPVPDGMFVCHHCDNPPCTNPEHLFLGTHGDNMADMYRKGRGRKRGLPGELSPAARLTAADVAEMRRHFQIGLGRGSAGAAEAYGICQPHAYRILSGKKWKAAQ
jgi:hypothetical protein